MFNETPFTINTTTVYNNNNKQTIGVAYSFNLLASCM